MKKQKETKTAVKTKDGKVKKHPSAPTVSIADIEADFNKLQGGRPTVMTAFILQKLEAAFMYGCSDEQACIYAEISPGTLYNFQLKYPEFLQRKQLLKANPRFLARKSMVDELQKNPEMAYRYLKDVRDEEFADVPVENPFGLTINNNTIIQNNVNRANSAIDGLGEVAQNAITDAIEKLIAGDDESGTETTVVQTQTP